MLGGTTSTRRVPAEWQSSECLGPLGPSVCCPVCFLSFCQPAELKFSLALFIPFWVSIQLLVPAEFYAGELA